jgi:DNA-binding XRE family transcriptional regulator
MGQTLWCVLRGRVRVCGWGQGRVRWPLGRAGHGGKGAYIVTPELARALRVESAAAIRYWWGVGSNTVTHWRRRLGVEQFNEGTLKLYSQWKETKLPDQAIAFSPAALRRFRLRRGLTQRQVATQMGWTSINSYGQMESGRRRRATLPTLRRLAAVLECKTPELLAGRWTLVHRAGSIRTP